MKILENIDLKNYNTFMISNVARWFSEVNCIEDVFSLIKNEIKKFNKIYLLGEGSNTIFTGNFDGLVVKNQIKGRLVKFAGNDIFVEMGSGEKREDFVIRCAKNNIVGTENLAHIPSSIGASAVQNIGAYGKEAKDVIYQVEGVDLVTGETRILDNHECNFSYRDSIFKHELKDKFFITKIVYKLKKFTKDYNFDCEYSGISEKILEKGKNTDTITPMDFVNIITEIRNSKLPDWKQIGTAGSFFKNPIITKDRWDSLQKVYPELKGFDAPNGIKLSAGQLIDLCGFKGKSNGKVGTYSKHALILVNEGNASGLDVLQFSSEIQKQVEQKFGVKIDPEVVFC